MLNDALRFFFQFNFYQIINMVDTPLNICINKNYRKILKTFGRKARLLIIAKQSFDVAAGIPEEEIVHCIIAICYGNLQHLSLTGFSLSIPQENNDMKWKFCRMVSNLKTLTLKGIELRNCGVLFEFLSGLEKLNIKDLHMDLATASGMKRTFPHLRDVVITDVDIVNCAASTVHTFLAGFLKANPTIEKLFLINGRVSPIVFRVVTNQLPVLDELMVHICSDSQAEVLQRLQHVKRLTLKVYENANIAPLLMALSARGIPTHLKIYFEFFRQIVWESLANIESLNSINLIAMLPKDSRILANVFNLLSSRLKNVIEFRADNFEFQSTDILIQFIGKNSKLELCWLSSMPERIHVDPPEIKLMATTGAPSAPKLVVLFTDIHAKVLRVSVEGSIVLVQPYRANGHAQAPAYEVRCPEGHLRVVESHDAFISWCRSSASNGDLIHVEFIE